MRKSDYTKKSTNINSLLPEYLKNAFNTSFFDALHNKMLTKEESDVLMGYIGDVGVGDKRDPYIGQINIDREVNALTPTMFIPDEDGGKVFTFDDILNRMRILGVDTNRFSEWGKAKSFNLHFPVNLDKFINYPKYRWYGHLLKIVDSPVSQGDHSDTFNPDDGTFTQPTPATIWEVTHNFGYDPIAQIYIKDANGNYAQAYPVSIEYSMDHNSLRVEFSEPQEGVIRMFDESGSYLIPVVAPSYNKTLQPEYVLCAKAPTMVHRNAFNNFNYWAHEDDIEALGFDINKTIQAINPIIEFEVGVELSSHYKDGKPCAPTEPGAVHYEQKKIAMNQPPLFNLYNHDGSFSGKVSPILSYDIDPSNIVDDDLKMRVDTDEYGDFMMRHGLVDEFTGKLYFFKQNGTLKSCWEAGPVVQPRYLARDAEQNLVEIDPATDIDGVGAWVVPDQMFYNVQHKNRTTIGYADLFNHFSDVIAQQPGLTGNPYGKNNYRSLSQRDFGLGGCIKDFNTSFDLFMGLTNQPDLSVLGVIDFAQTQYDELLTSVEEFFTQNLGDILTTSRLAPSPDYNYIESDTVALYQRFINTDLKLRNQSFAFGDTTAGVPAFPATLPYFGMSELTEPNIEYVKETGEFALRHHDGHLTLLTKKNTSLLNALANKKFMRSTGIETAGYVGPTPPANPFKNMFWYNTSSAELMMFSVIADIERDRTNLAVGDLWFNRGNQTLYQWTGETWVDMPNKDVAWVVVRPEVIMDHIKLLMERDLFSRCFVAGDQFDYDAIAANSPAQFREEMRVQFMEYASRFSLDPFDTDFSASNAFTWNYSGVTVDGLTRPYARWYDMYEAYFGTVRPDQEPWKLQGYADKPVWWDSTYPLVDNKWPEQMWMDIINDSTPGRAAPTGRWLRKLGVNIQTGELLPPYVSDQLDGSQFSLLTTVPPRINMAYTFGDNGPIEFSWKRSIDYKYGLAKTAFRVSPIAFVDSLWGYNRISTNNGYEFDRAVGRKRGANEIVLHGEENTRQYEVQLTDLLVNPSAAAQTWTIECVGQTASGSMFAVSGSIDGVQPTFDPRNGVYYTSPFINFRLDVGDLQASIGDKFIVQNGGVEFVRSAIEKHNGLSQWFANILRYNSIDIDRTINGKILRGWEPRLAYRATGLISTENIDIKSDNYTLHRRDFTTILKKNERFKNYWLNTIRVQLVQKGTVTTVEGGTHIPHAAGADWVYRVEVLNNIDPSVYIFTYDEADTAGQATFRVLDGSTTKTVWKRPTKKNGLAKVSMPKEIIGIQNVVNFLFGYADMLAADGWRFSFESGNIDEATGRSIDWQLEIERFIEAQYLGVATGEGVIVNPFLNKVWFETPFGMVSSFKTTSHGDVRVLPQVMDMNSNIISAENDLRLFRNDDITEIHSDVPMVAMNLFLDSYEHVVVFNDYAANEDRRGLVYDSFLGVRVKRMHLTTKRQRKYTGRPTFGGHYLLNGNVKRNIESNVESIKLMYDSAKMVEGTASATAARSTVGYTPKKYMDILGLSDASQFGFWRGMIHNKGSNLSVNAFLNSARFVSAELDEYWAYKLADYGDARPNLYPEIRLSIDENKQKYLKLQFLEGETAPQAGFVGISAFDDNRWFNLTDVGTDMYFNAEELAKLAISVPVTHALHDLSLNGHPVIADYVEVVEEIAGQDPQRIVDVDRLTAVDTFPTNPLAGDMVFLKDINTEGRPSGAYRALSVDVWEAVKSFELVNSTTIRFFMLPTNGSFVVTCFGPSQPKYNPAKLIDYKDRVVLQDISLFDPARGNHVVEGRAMVDLIGGKDPAQYNYSVRTEGNSNFTPLVPWNEKQVGKVWWDTTNLNYLPYSDVKRYPDVDVRLSLWGALSDYGTVDLHEWTESSVHPKDYAALVKAQQGVAEIRPEDKASGVVSFNELYKRVRTWKHRPVAWKRTDAPGIRAHEFVSEYNIPVIITTPRVGPAKAILHSTTWSDIEFSAGMHISAYAGGKLVGDAEIEGEPSFLIGADYNMDMPVMSYAPVQPPAFAAPVVPLANISVVESGGAISAGQIVLRHEDIGGIPHVRAINMATRVSEVVEVLDSEAINGAAYDMVFPRVGITVKTVTNFGHTTAGFTTPQARRQALAYAIGNQSHQITIRSAISVDVKIPFVEQADGLVSVIANIGVEARSFSVWEQPSTLVGELPAPNNVWEPVYGEYTTAEISQTMLDLIKSAIESPLEYDTGETVSQYEYEFGPWQRVESDVRDAKYDGTGDAFFNKLALPVAVTASEVSVYVNGVIRRTSEFEVSATNPRVVKVKTALKLGDEVRVVKKRYEPTKAEQEFDPLTKENPSMMAQYKYDYQYTIREFRNESGEVEKTLYYFWVRDKEVVKPGRSMSLLSAAQVLTTNPNPFGIFQNLKPQSGSRPVRYTQFVTVGLNRYVTKEDTYKLRFTKNFTLRDDPENIALKNTHSEWVLIRENQRVRIPEQLWNKLIDSATGEDVAGNPLPSLARVEYDKRYNSRVRYGFGQDQVLVDKELAIRSILHAIFVASSTKVDPVTNVAMSNEFKFLDYSKASEWFLTPESTRKTLTDIWNLGKPEQINYIFFTVFHDALAENYEFSDIFKTSMIAAHSIRLFNNIDF